MKKILSVLAILIVLVSCNSYNPPVNPGTNGNGTNNTTKNPVASFTYETSHPFYVKFVNTSKDADRYSWDFGDGQKSTEKSPIHKYSGKGVYKVTLSAHYGVTSSGYLKTNTYTKNITVVAPTKCYINGIVYEKIPKNNEYYNIRFTDDYVLFETLYWYTDWVMLSAANMPYTYTLKNKKQIDFSKSEYVMRLQQNGSTSGDGSQVAKWTVYPSNLKKNFSEQTTGTASNAKVTLLLEWKD